MSDPIRQHHVPQLYLRRFAVKEKNVYKINVLRKGQQKCFKANVEDIAVEKHFYTIGCGADKYVWEKYYASEIEPKMKTILLSGKLNDAPSGRLFRADFRTLQMCQSL